MGIEELQEIIMCFCWIGWKDFLSIRIVIFMLLEKAMPGIMFLNLHIPFSSIIRKLTRPLSTSKGSLYVSLSLSLSKHTQINNCKLDNSLWEIIRCHTVSVYIFLSYSKWRIYWNLGVTLLVSLSVLKNYHDG